MTDKDVLIQKQPQSVGQADALGLFLLKRYKDAEALYDDLLQQEPDNISFRFNRLLCQLQYSTVNTAFLDQIIQYVNDLPAQGYLCLADVLSDLGREEEALVFVNKALEQDECNIDAYILKAALLSDLERSDELFALMQAVYPRLKEDDRIDCLVASYVASFGNIRQAKYLLKKALKRNYFGVIQNHLFYSVLFETEQIKDIPEYGMEALSISNRNVAVWFELLRAYLALEQYEDAEASLIALSRLVDLSDELKIQWADVLLKQEKYDEAFDLLRRLPPDAEEALLLLKKLFQELQQDGQYEKVREKAKILDEKQEKTPEIQFICDMVLSRDRTEAQPLSLVRLTSDENALEAYRILTDSSYRLPMFLEKVLNDLDIPIGQSLDILDLGCGVGEMAFVLEDFSRPLGRLDGADVSPVSLDIALQQGCYTSVKEGDLVSLCQDKAQSKQYDVIVCMNVLSCFSNLDVVFKSVKKALRPNGVFIFSVLPLYEMDRQFVFRFGQFYHGVHYVSSCLKTARLNEILQQEGEFFKENDTCLIFAAQKKK